MATVPSFRTWTAGEIVAASYMNSNIRDAGNFFLATPVFEGRQTVSQNASSSTDTAITFDTEDIDNDGGHSTSSNTSRFTAQTAGRYQVSGGVGWNGNATGRREAIIAVNGTRNNGSEAGVAVGGNANSVYVPSRTKTIFLNVNDYVEIFGWQDSGGTLGTWVTTSGQSSMSVRWIGTT